uniref:RING-type domain-containing protein n=1 Tax=Sinocyclocheilus anshuiensis TaxID=1608454 RepID=A0A671RD50_9TELE
CKAEPDQSRRGVCEQVLRDPVSISCGHSFCRQCISFCRDQPSEDFDCPQCRERSRSVYGPQCLLVRPAGSY